MTGWTAQLPNGGGAVDRKTALEEQGVRHGRYIVLTRVPHALHPLHVVAPRWGLVTLARRGHRPGVNRSALHGHGHALGGIVDVGDDARRGGKRKGSGKNLGRVACLAMADRPDWCLTTRAGIMQWTVRLEARTDKGEVKTAELVTFRRPAMAGTLAEIGLTLAEAKALLTKLQASILCDQLAEYAAHRRVCPDCGMLQPLKDRRTRRLQTLFGTVEIEVPRFRVCRCRRSAPRVEVAFSPVSELLTARCTPELERVQAELGARTSFREAARILEALLPASPANHESVRTRTHAVALQIEAGDRRTAAAVVPAQDGPKAAGSDASRPIVMLDGAYVRAVPGHQLRNFEAICGKVEQEGHSSRRFALVRSVAEQPHGLLRAALREQGWRERKPVTAISDGDPALPALVRSATGGPVEHILDWFRAT